MRLTGPRSAYLGPGRLAIGLAAASLGGSDGTPRARSVDLAASRTAAADRGRIGLPDLGSKIGDGVPTPLEARGRRGRPLQPFVTTSGENALTS